MRELGMVMRYIIVDAEGFRQDGGSWSTEESAEQYAFSEAPERCLELFIVPHWEADIGLK